MNIYKTQVSDAFINSSLKEYCFGENLRNINISSGFALAAYSVRENLKSILQSIEVIGEYPVVSITGHSLGGALAQICYLSMRYGNYYSSIKYDKKEKLFCYPFSAPPFIEIVSQNLLLKEQEILESSNIFHTFINSDLVRDIDIDNSPNPGALNLGTSSLGLRHTGVRKNIKHPGKVIFRLNSGLLSKIAFPQSHSYNLLFDEIHNVFKQQDIEKRECCCTFSDKTLLEDLKKLVDNLKEDARVEYIKEIRLANFIVALRLISKKMASSLSVKLTKEHFQIYEKEIVKVLESWERFLTNPEKCSRKDLLTKLKGLIILLSEDSRYKTVGSYTKAFRVKLIILFFCIKFSTDTSLFRA